MATADQDRKKKAHRSPAYPSMGLKATLEHVETIYKHEKRSAAPVGVVASHCGTDIKSSKGLRLIAALKQYGLAVEEGSGEDRQVRLSDLALDVLLAENEEDKAEAVKKAALAPTIHKKIWNNCKGHLPSDATLRVYLLRQLDFNDNYVDRFIKQFRATLGFATLTSDDVIGNGQAASNGDEELDASLDAPTSPADMARRRGSSPPPPTGSPYIVFPLADGNKLEVKLSRKVSKSDFERIKTLIELSEPSLVQEDHGNE